jgi:3-isopropylmalate dehydrogenase
MKKSIAVLPGDGVGPEVTKQAVKILKRAADKYSHEFVFKYGLIGACAIEKTGDPLPDDTLLLCHKSDAILFGAIGEPKYDLDPKTKIRPEQGLLKLRKSLNLYTNIRPVYVFPELTDSSPIRKEIITAVDFVVIRELTGGIYFGKPRLRKNNGKTAIDTSVYTEKEILRIADIAFNLALRRRKKITSVDKANVLETSRLWRETVMRKAKKFPEVILNHMFVDNAAMQIIKNPRQFDVILTENMFGDILTDEASIIAGSIGLLPSASIGNKISLYEPIHGAFHKAKGKDIANPIAAILSAALMLRSSFTLETSAKSI